MSAVVTLTFTNVFPPRGTLTYTSNNRQEDFFFKFSQKPKNNKTQNQLQDKEKDKTQKDWSNNLGRHKTKFWNKKYYIQMIYFSLKPRDIFWDHNLSKTKQLLQISGSKAKNITKHATKNVRYDNFNAFYVWRMSMQAWVPAVGLVTTYNRSSHFQYFWHKKNKVESKTEAVRN